MKKTVIIGLSFFLLSCKGNKERFKKETLGIAHFEVPTDWKKTSIKGVDAEVTAFIISACDTVYFDYGSYNNSFNEFLWYSQLLHKMQKSLPEYTFHAGIFL